MVPPDYLTPSAQKLIAPFRNFNGSDDLFLFEQLVIRDNGGALKRTRLFKSFGQLPIDRPPNCLAQLFKARESGRKETKAAKDPILRCFQDESAADKAIHFEHYERFIEI